MRWVWYAGSSTDFYMTTILWFGCGKNGLKQKLTVNEFVHYMFTVPSIPHTHIYTYSTHKFISYAKYRHRIQLRCIPSRDLKKREGKCTQSKMPIWFMCEGKGGISRHNMQVPRVGCQHDLHVRKKQRDAFYILLEERERNKEIKPRLISSEGKDTSMLWFLPFNFSMTSGGAFSLIKVLYSWNESWPWDSTATKTLTRVTGRISRQCHQVHMTVREEYLTENWLAQ